MIVVNSKYTKKEKWIATERGEIQIGGSEQEFLPYELLLGALSSCFYYTLRDILAKKKIEVDEIEIRIEGNKRTERPETLEKAVIHITYVGDISEKDAERSAFLAGKYCSIHHTLSKVAEFTNMITIKEK